MNISMLDMFSLAWKINLVEKGIGNRDVLLPSYEQERKYVAEKLLEFDSAYSRLFSGRSPTSQQLTDKENKAKQLGAVDAQKFIEAFKSNVRLLLPLFMSALTKSTGPLYIWLRRCLSCERAQHASRRQARQRG